MAKAKPDHGNAGYALGVPAMPQGLSAEAQEVWQFVCKQIPAERSSPADKLALIGLAKWFAHWDALMASLQNDPADARLQRQATSAWNIVDQQLRQFGLTLVSRARLPAGKAEGKGKEESPIAKILQLREGKRRPG